MLVGMEGEFGGDRVTRSGNRVTLGMVARRSHGWRSLVNVLVRWGCCEGGKWWFIDWLL